jgi:hypothetical protein
MRAPDLIGVVERRLLVNYRTEPDVVARLLPGPLRPQLVDGYAVAGICLIRLGGLRPAGLALGGVGLRSESAAHRVAVEWDTPGGVATGAYIVRRDTGSRLNALAGGRVFPGVQHRARFAADESDTDVRVTVAGAVRVDVHVRTVGEWGGSALFADLAAASAFFRKDDCGYSPGVGPGRLDGMRLSTDRWRVEPVEVRSAHSSFFADAALFPSGSATLDSALLMRAVPVRCSALPAVSGGAVPMPSGGPR